MPRPRTSSYAGPASFSELPGGQSGGARGAGGGSTLPAPGAGGHKKQPRVARSAGRDDARGA
eukprot:5642206-Prymnesium_polylepis.1